MREGVRKGRENDSRDQPPVIQTAVEQEEKKAII